MGESRLAETQTLYLRNFRSVVEVRKEKETLIRRGGQLASDWLL